MNSIDTNKETEQILNFKCSFTKIEENAPNNSIPNEVKYNSIIILIPKLLQSRYIANILKLQEYFVGKI